MNKWYGELRKQRWLKNKKHSRQVKYVQKKTGQVTRHGVHQCITTFVFSIQYWFRKSSESIRSPGQFTGLKAFRPGTIWKHFVSGWSVVGHTLFYFNSRDIKDKYKLRLKWPESEDIVAWLQPDISQWGGGFYGIWPKK